MLAIIWIIGWSYRSPLLKIASRNTRNTIWVVRLSRSISGNDQTSVQRSFRIVIWNAPMPGIQASMAVKFFVDGKDSCPEDRSESSVRHWIEAILGVQQFGYTAFRLFDQWKPLNISRVELNQIAVPQNMFSPIYPWYTSAWLGSSLHAVNALVHSGVEWIIRQAVFLHPAEIRLVRIKDNKLRRIGKEDHSSSQQTWKSFLSAVWHQPIRLRTPFDSDSPGEVYVTWKS